MSRVKRRDSLFLALMLAISLVSFSGHATVHAKASVDQCLLCASHSDPNSAVQTQLELKQAWIELAVPPAFPLTVKLHTAPLFTRQARAPPPTS